MENLLNEADSFKTFVVGHQALITNITHASDEVDNPPSCGISVHTGTKSSVWNERSYLEFKKKS